MVADLHLQKVELSTLLGDYPCTAALKTGRLTSDLVKFSFADVKVANAGFKPLVRDAKFDIGELAIVTYLQAKMYGKPYVLMPALVVGRAQHHALAYNPEHGELTPQNLADKRIGVRAYTVTTGVWIRGILKQQYGVDLDKIKWVTFEDPHLAEYIDPGFIERAPAGKNMNQMLLDGELDAAVVGDKLPDARLKNFLPNHVADAGKWEAEHGIPVNHMLVIRNEISRTRPDIVREVFRVMKASRDEAIKAGDKNAAKLTYGIEENRKSLETIIDIAFDQKLITRRFSVDELFDDATRCLR